MPVLSLTLSTRENDALIVGILRHQRLFHYLRNDRVVLDSVISEAALIETFVEVVAADTGLEDELAVCPPVLRSCHFSTLFPHARKRRDAVDYLECPVFDLLVVSLQLFDLLWCENVLDDSESLDLQVF